MAEQQQQPTKQEVLDALKKKGVTDLEGLVDRIVSEANKGGKTDLQMADGYVSVSGIL